MELTRKHRPTTFDTYIGNEISKKIVMNMLSKKNIPHSMLFEGNSGCGKTTLARIVGKALLCKKPKEDGQACEECSNCKSINQKFILQGGRVPGIPIEELDVNSTGKKDDVLEIIQEMRRKPLNNSRKVYIFDEVQVMSTKAQSSLLKVMEEPSEWVYIILCTTDPENLLTALKSRLTAIKIRKPTTKDIVNNLERVCQEENLKYDYKALDLVAKYSKRVPRDSIKNLEKISNSGDISYANVSKILQVEKAEVYIEYFKNLNKEVFDALNFLNNIKDRYNIEIEEFMVGLADFTVDAFNIKMGVSIDSYTEEEAKTISKLFKQIDTRDLIGFMVRVEEALKIKTNPKYAVTMLTLKTGFPQYFKDRFEEKEIKEELKKEKIKGAENYLENRKVQEREIVSNNEEITEEDLADLFEEIVEVEEENGGE